MATRVGRISAAERACAFGLPKGLTQERKVGNVTPTNPSWNRKTTLKLAGVVFFSLTFFFLKMFTLKILGDLIFFDDLELKYGSERPKHHRGKMHLQDAGDLIFSCIFCWWRTF